MRYPGDNVRARGIGDRDGEIMREENGLERIDPLAAARRARQGEGGACPDRDGNDVVEKLTRELGLLMERLESERDCRIRAEAELKECREAHRRLKANIPGMVYRFALHPDGSFSFPEVDGASRDLFGIEPDRLMADAGLLMGLIHPDDRGKFFASVKASARTLTPWREELRHLVNGELRWYDCMSRPERHLNGDIVWDGIILDITPRRRAEQALNRSERNYRVIFENAPLGIFRSTPDGRLLNVNGALARLLKYGSPGEMIELVNCSGMADTVYEEPSRCRDQVESVVRHGGWRIFEERFRCRDGSIITSTFHLRAVPRRDGEAPELEGFVEDVTERKRAEERLNAQVHFLQQLLDSIPLPVFYKGTDGRYLGCNSAFETYCGYSRERIVGATVHELVPRECARVYQQADTALFEAPGVQEYETEFLDRQGTQRYVIFNKATFVNPDNRVAGLVGAITDITERKRAEQELLLSNDVLRAIIQAAPTAIIGLDREGRVRHVWNPGAERMLGWSSEEVMGRPFPGAEPEGMESLSALAGGDGHGAGSELRLRRRDGSCLDCCVYASPLHGAEGQVAGSIAVLVDVTERRQVEESLRLANLIVENSPAVLFRWRVAEGWPVELVSRNVIRFGYTPDELTSGVVPFSSLVYPDDLERVAAEVAEFSRRGVDRFQQEYRIVTKEGDVRWIDDRTAMERDDQGGVSHFQGVVMDITERKQAEEMIRSALAEKVVLLKEIHHRVKNNLQIISTLLDLQAESLRDEGALRAFRESQDRIRAMALVHEKLYRTENLSSIDFAGYIESLTTHLYNSYAIDPERVSLSIDAGDVRLGIDQAIPCGLIINELVSNALKYAFPGDSVGGIIVRFQGGGGGPVLLTVADSGVGLPDGLDFRSGETLGLQLVRMLVKQLRGEVALDNSRGACFEIRFPERCMG